MTRIRCCMFVILAAITITGCQQRVELVLNKDGSGTLSGERVLDERIGLLTEMLAKQGGAAMFVPEMLTNGLIENGLLQPDDFDTLEKEPQPDGAMKVVFEAKFDDIYGLLGLLERNFDGLSLYRNDEGKGVLALEDTEANMGPGDGEDPADAITMLYVVAKGLLMETSFTAPSPVNANGGDVDGNHVHWMVDLRNREGLDVTRTLMAQLDAPVLQAAFSLDGLGFDLPEKDSDAMAQPAAAAPTVTTPTPGDITTSISAVVVSKTQTDPAGPVDEANLQLTFALQMPEGANPMEVASPESVQLTSDGTTQEVDVASWNAYDWMDGWQCDLAVALPDPAMKHIDKLYAEAFMTMAGDAETLNFTRQGPPEHGGQRQDRKPRARRTGHHGRNVRRRNLIPLRQRRSRERRPDGWP